MPCRVSNVLGASKVHFMPVRFTLIALSPVAHGLFNLSDVFVKLKHVLVVVVDGRG
jgi:hypothetical protein